MGILSFIKEVGEKLWDPRSNEGKDNSQEQQQKMQDYLKNLNLAGTEGVKINVENSKVTISGEVPSQEIKEKVGVALGNVKGISDIDNQITVTNSNATNSTGEQREERYYTVKQGDTLSGIAKAMYGDANQYNKIFEANKPMLTHPDKIYPGQVLRIPD